MICLPQVWPLWAPERESTIAEQIGKPTKIAARMITAPTVSSPDTPLAARGMPIPTGMTTPKRKSRR